MREIISKAGWLGEILGVIFCRQSNVSAFLLLYLEDSDARATSTPRGSFPRLCPTNIGNLRDRASKHPLHYHHLNHPPLPPTTPTTCSPAVSPLAAPAPPRRASRPSSRGVSPRPQRSMRSLLSLSSELTVPTPARWYVTGGHTGTMGR
jgi:hypothetical protein